MLAIRSCLLRFIQPLDPSFNLGRNRLQAHYGPLHCFRIKWQLFRWNYHRRTFEDGVAVTSIQCDERSGSQGVFSRFVQRLPVHRDTHNSITRFPRCVKGELNTRHLRKATGLRVLGGATDAVFECRSQGCSSDFYLNQFVLEWKDRKDVAPREFAWTDSFIRSNRTT